MDKQHKNILYIGPYNEESNRGRIALANINGLIKAGHNLKIIPIYSDGKKNKETPSSLIAVEKANIENYDICIQHCEPMQYAFSNRIEKNIGIFGCKNISPETIIHTRLALLDSFVVHSKKVYNGLSRNLARHISNNMIYCPTYIDLEYVSNYKKDKLDWSDSQKYYFYTELEFTDEYDWEKIIYVYFTTFKHQKTELIIKTTQIKDEIQADEINKLINKIALSAHVVPNKDNVPKVLNGIFDEETTMALYNTIDCFIDCGRTQEYNSNLFLAAALKKDLICNSKLAASDFFSNTYQVDGYPCNINFTDHSNICHSSIYETYYTMESNSLKQQLRSAYINRYNKKIVDDTELGRYDISNVNKLLC